MNVKMPPRIEFARLPTPVQRLPRLSAHLGGPEIYIKRDDLTGCAISGNKVRKLEFVLADALEQKADTIITCGGVQSNHCRATAVLAARLGMRAILVLRGKEPEQPDGNLFLGWLAGAELRYITPAEYERRDEMMSKIAREVADGGGRPYVIPEGASTEVGAWGYINAARELKEQCAAEELRFDALVHPIGSAGTTSGLALGCAIWGFPIPLTAVAVCDDAEYFSSRINEIVGKCIERYDLEAATRADAVEILDGYIGPGYAVPYPEVIDTIKLVARLEGVFLDPVYTGKAMWCLVDQVQKGRFRKGRKILFLHTGGIFGLLAQNTEFNWR